MKEACFGEHIGNPGHVIFRRVGTQFAVKGDTFPAEAASAESKNGLFLRARDDSFALFGTGVLEELADDFAEIL